ncbi:Scr1 family TA system antitoxin-like transcriptional regulator [Lentzea flaviverrucosa]|uniref:Helix-turn-helix domain-containing protein n=1 Tax=Lentzea flaviverrucosa TaxID=200379 RepID=A0A1H9TMX7_9PSEU|nr:Scr1 family TA system antitoxin-like transcriptional regulator [Lentzea flaviverrucosa]RDI33546.1 helix-turn-helix protein [Lentzea flaviverrucosa]SER98418.1 Helix-turn-helix domain-containing protein [Lentzea flaviverrucosa]
MPTSPVVAGWELALRLKEQREREGVDVRTITQALGFTRNYWSAVENERKILSEENLVKLLDLLDFDPRDRQELLDLREAAKERGWWTRYGNLLDNDLQRLIGLEAGADTIRWYESLLIPGLLQTADYARAIMTPAVTTRTVEVDQRIEVRQRRQERLVGESPLRLVAVLSEAALRQEIGGPAVLRRQLEHLARSIEDNRDGLEVRVIPFTAKACGLFGSSTVQLLDFPVARLPTVMYQESVTTRAIIDDSSQVRDIKLTFLDTQDRALSAQKSLELIHQRIEELD